MNRLMIRSVFSAVLLLALLSLPSIASADSILWTLTGVTFSDGGTASGSFMFNGTTFSSIDITTSLGNTYTTISPVFMSSDTTLWLGAPGGDLTGTPILGLLFDGPLVNSGGTVTDNLSLGDLAGGEGNCIDAVCSDTTAGRSITGGGATSTVSVVTPEPSALSLLCVALAALLAGVAIRKASQA